MPHCGQIVVELVAEDRPEFLQQRGLLAKLLEVDREPFIVFTADTPGLAAAQQILSSDHERVGVVLQDEFDAFLQQVEDAKYRWHVHVWSYFRKVLEPAFEAEAEAQAKYPIPDGSSYWQHSEGTLWAINAGRGVDHLWRWDDQNPELLEEALTHWVV